MIQTFETDTTSAFQKKKKKKKSKPCVCFQIVLWKNKPAK